MYKNQSNKRFDLFIQFAQVFVGSLLEIVKTFILIVACAFIEIAFHKKRKIFIFSILEKK